MANMRFYICLLGIVCWPQMIAGGGDEGDVLVLPKLTPGMSQKEYHDQMSAALSRFPGAVYSFSSGGETYSGNIGDPSPNSRYASPSTFSGYPSSNSRYASPPTFSGYPSSNSRYASPPTLSSYPPPNNRFSNNPLSLSSPPSRSSPYAGDYRSSPPQTSSYQSPPYPAPRRSFTSPTSSNMYNTPPTETSSPSYPLGGVQNDFNQPPRTYPLAQDSSWKRPMAMGYPQPQKADIPADTSDEDLSQDYKSPGQLVSGHDDNPFSQAFGSGAGLGRGGQQSENYAPQLGGLFQVPQNKPADPTPTYDPKGGKQAADSLASAIIAGIRHTWQTERQLGGPNAITKYQEICEDAVSNQQPSVKAMKRADRTLFDVLGDWQTSMIMKLEEFFSKDVGDTSLVKGSEQMNMMIRLFAECVRPKLVLAKV